MRFAITARGFVVALALNLLLRHGNLLGVPIRAEIRTAISALRHRPTPQSADTQICRPGDFATLRAIKEDVRSPTAHGQLCYPPEPTGIAFPAAFPSGVAAEAIAQQKLTRLLELRAVIDSLRCEHEARDPLLSWVVARRTGGLAVEHRGGLCARD